MQKLLFEEAWDKTISNKDRQTIIQSFEEQPITEGVSFSFLWQATNYKNEQLLTVFIHNNTATSLSIKEAPIAYQAENNESITNVFTVPKDIPPYTSMPWTFIFSLDKTTTEHADFTIRYEHE